MFSIADTIRTMAESSGIWVFSFKYFECAVLFPFIVTKQKVPTWQTVCLRVTFWLVLAASNYFSVLMQLNLYHIMDVLYLKPAEHSRLEPLWQSYRVNSFISLGLRVLTGLFLAVALIIMHFRVKAQGFSLNLKTQAFVLNLILLVLYSISVAVFYTELSTVYRNFEFMIGQDDTVIQCWIVKNFAGFLCFGYLSYVVLVQFGGGNKVNLRRSESLSSATEENPSETMSTNDRESLYRRQREFKNLGGSTIMPQ